MTRSPTPLALLCVASFTLTACQTSNTTAPVAQPTPQPTTQAVTAPDNGRGLFLALTGGQTVDVATINGRSPQGGNAITFNADGNGADLTVTGTLDDASAVTNATDVDQTGANAFGEFAADNFVTLNTTATPGAQDSQAGTYMVFNGTTNPGMTSGNIGVFYSGNAPATMPITGTASYSGQALYITSATANGTDYQNPQAANARPDVTTVTMTADFGAGTVQGTLADIQLTDGVNPAFNAFDVGFQGTITGGSNAYTGTASLTPEAGSPIPAQTLNQQQAIGAFFGPNAAETAGSVQLESTGANNSAVIFGGAYQGNRN
jgi:hypothetical protein